MGKRFSRLRYALETIKKPDGTGTTTLAEGSILDEFRKFEIKEKKVSYTVADKSKPGSLKTVSISPFYFGVATGQEVAIKFSNRSATAAKMETVITAANHVTFNEALHQPLSNFKPAQAVVSVIETNEDGTAKVSPETSKITGIPYAKILKDNYTIPYGAKTEKLNEAAVRKDILGAVLGIADTTASVSFSSEAI